MATLDGLAGQQTASIARDDRERVLTITGGLLQVNEYLHGDYSGYRIVCNSSGGLAFNCPDQTAQTGILVSSIDATDNHLVFSQAEGKKMEHGGSFTFTNTGGITAFNTTNTYYARKGIKDVSGTETAIVHVYNSQAAALAGGNSGLVSFANEGTPGNIRISTPEYKQRNIGQMGSNDYAQVVIVEESNAHRFGTDNYKETTAISRFQQGKIKLENLMWVVDTGATSGNSNGTRSDFDTFVGTGSPPDPKPHITWDNCYFYVDPRFNHLGSPDLYINNVLWENVNPEDNIEELEIIYAPQQVSNLRFPGGQILRVLPFAQANFTPILLQGLSGLNGVRISTFVPPGRSEVGSISNKIVDMRDYAGDVEKNVNTGNNDGIDGILRDTRTVKFTFSGVDAADVAGATLTIQNTSNNANFPTDSSMSGRNPLTLNVGSDGTASDWFLLRQINHNTQTKTPFTTYRVRLNHPNVSRKQWTFTMTEQADGDVIVPSAEALVRDIFPDGTRPSTISVPTECTTLSHIHRAIKKWEADNISTSPSHSFVTVQGTNIRANNYNLVLSRTATDLVSVDSGSATITVKCGASVSASNGLTGVEAYDGNATRRVSTTGTIDTSGIILTDYVGGSPQSASLISIANDMGASVLFTLVNTTTNASTGSATIASGATGTISITAKGLGSNYRLVGKRVGYRHFSQDVDLTGGGTRSITAALGTKLIQPDGTDSYISSVSVAGISQALTFPSGSPRLVLRLSDGTYSARALFKYFEDFVAGASGAPYLGKNGQQIDYIRDSIKGDQIYLGANTKVQALDDAENAIVRASLFATDDNPVLESDNNNRGVQTVEGLNVAALGTALLVDQDFDTGEAGTQSIVSKLDAIKTAVDAGGGGSTLTAQQVWEYSGTRDLSTSPPTAAQVWGYTAGSGRTLTSAAGLTASQATQLQNASDKATQNNNALNNSVYGLAAMKTAQDMIPTAQAGGTSPTALYSLYNFTIKRFTAYNPNTYEFTLSEADYDALPSTVNNLDFWGWGSLSNPRPIIQGAYRIRWQGSVSGSTVFVRWLRKVDDTNHRVKLFLSESDANSNTNPLVQYRRSGFSYQRDTGTTAEAYFILNFQDFTDAGGLWSTDAWEVSSLASAYIKIDSGFEMYVGLNNHNAEIETKLQVSVESTAAGDFDDWYDVPLEAGSWNDLFSAGESDSYYDYVATSHTQIDALNVLSNVVDADDNAVSITDGKFVKFRIYFVSATGVYAVNNAYLNITILPSLTVSGGASTGGLNQQQSTWLSNVNTAVTSSTHGNSAIKTAVDGVPASVWGRDLSGTAVDDSAADLLKDASTSGGGGGGGATASQIWGFSMPSTPTSGSVAEYLKGAHDDAGAAKDDLANSTDGLGALKTAIDDIESGGGGGGATAAQIWGYDTSSLTGSKAGAYLNTAATDATAAKDDLANATDGLGALKSAIDDVATDVDALPTTAAPGASDIAEAVSQYPIRGATAALTVSSVTSGLLILPSAPTGFTNGDIVRVDNNGGYTALTQGEEYYGAINSNTVLTLYEARANAIANAFTDWTNAGTNGTPSAIRLTHIPIAGTTGQIIGETKTAVDALPTAAAPSASSIADAVWVEDLSGTASAGTAAALIKNASTSGFDSTDRTNLGSIKTSVEGIPSKEDIAAAVLAATLHEGQRAVLNFTPTEHNNDSFKIRTVDANQLRNGDRINFIQNGGFTNNGAQIEPSEEFYCYKAYDDIFLYANTEDALVGNSSYVRLGTGTVSNVRLRRPADSRYITVQSALDLIVSNSASAIHGIDAVIDAVSSIGGDVGGLTSANFVETGLSLKQAMQITTAILAGQLNVTNNGSTYTFHRLDADSTAVIRADASAAGRTIPTRDPT